MHRVLIIGAYGFFGSRIAAALRRNQRIQLVLAGRNLEKATAMAYQLGLTADHARQLDAADAQLAVQLKKLRIDTVLHTAGPFQEQDYAVAQAAIRAGANYLDLADGRAFVGGITRLDAAARAANVRVVSGVSSLPALTCAVVDRYLDQFKQLEAVRVGITSGAVIPGIATVRAVLGYCGQPFEALENGRWTTVHGWLDTRLHEFPKPVGPRLLGRCDVPDLELLPKRYPTLKAVSFHAGFASESCHRVVEWLARRVQAGKLASAAPFAQPIYTVGKWLQPLLSDRGGMFVRMEGSHVENGAPHALTWHLVARDNHGPNVPCAAAIALVGKIAGGAPLPVGAMPCMALVDVDEMMDTLKGLSIRELAPPGLI
jgi:hypothetical protein